MYDLYNSERRATAQKGPVNVSTTSRIANALQISRQLPPEEGREVREVAGDLMESFCCLEALREFTETLPANLAERAAMLTAIRCLVLEALDVINRPELTSGILVEVLDAGSRFVC